MQFTGGSRLTKRIVSALKVNLNFAGRLHYGGEAGGCGVSFLSDAYVFGYVRGDVRGNVRGNWPAESWT